MSWDLKLINLRLSFFLPYKICKQLWVFKMSAPRNVTALGSTDLSMTTPTKAEANLTTSPKSEKVSSLNIKLFI